MDEIEAKVAEVLKCPNRNLEGFDEDCGFCIPCECRPAVLALVCEALAAKDEELAQVREERDVVLRSARRTEAALVRKEAEAAVLRVALENAIEGIEDMIVYVPEYFREKWGYDESLARIREAVRPIRERKKP